MSDIDQILTQIIKVALVLLPLAACLVALGYATVRVRERYLIGHAKATATVMDAAKVVQYGGRQVLVYGARSTNEALYESLEQDSDGDGVPDSEDESPELDDRHRLLVELCRATLNDGAYRATPSKLMTADDAQKLGGHFADRNRWQSAIDYGKEHSLIMTSNAGTLVKRGGVSDLLADLSQINPILKSAVTALPRAN